ncbi:DgyrCDS11397 [Dimorphilus gyrociliatus]|uniref:DgyrCDS11397 n=1 Tax=Dimorphilus gyrociliatus TaxID=2664684 RepID=A0A7I8W364_9ANNE|nr:DgyrCDS11397 [Dimorphilus gyrociliatus]
MSEKVRQKNSDKQFQKGKNKIHKKAYKNPKAFTGSRAEGQGFADVRKKKVMREYYKMLRKEKINKGSSETGREKKKNQKKEIRLNSPDTISDKSEKIKNKKSKKSLYKQVQEEYKKKQADKKIEVERVSKEKVEREKAIQDYKEVKSKKFSKLAKVNWKGQPNMTSQMHVLLDEIERMKKK